MADFAVSRSTVRTRLIAVFILTVLFTLLLIGRLAWIQIVRADELYEQAWEQWNHIIPVQTARGSIYDRHGRLLAGNTSAHTVAAIPLQIEDPLAISETLAPVLEMEPSAVYDLITMDRSAVYIKRKVSTEVAEKVRELGLSGIIFFNEERRYYPGGNLASQMLGFVGMDQGWAGLEIYYEDYLGSGFGTMVYPADRKGRQLPHDFHRYTLPQESYNLYLSVDETIQHILEKELARVMEQSAPKQAMAIAVDPNTGAVLAAASKPDFNPEEYDIYDPESWSLAPVTSSFEPGSTMKMVTVAAMIEEGLFEPAGRHYCKGYTSVNGIKINCWTVDRGGHGDISFYQSVGASCNPAFVEMSSLLGKEKFFQYLKAFGFGSITGIDYPGEASGLIFDPEAVGALELATSSFGQGISVTPIQQVMAVTAMINGGYLLQPYLVDEILNEDGEAVYKREPQVVRQVISKETSLELIDLMESVILNGTGYAAAVEGYRVAGKTGTAEKIGTDGAYLTDQFVYSLVGFAPLDNPRIVLYVAVDGVTRGPRLGVHTSAPLFRNIMEDTLNYLQVSPTELQPGQDNPEAD